MCARLVWLRAWVCAWNSLHWIYVSVCIYVQVCGCIQFHYICIPIPTLYRHAHAHVQAHAQGHANAHAHIHTSSMIFTHTGKMTEIMCMKAIITKSAKKELLFIEIKYKFIETNKKYHIRLVRLYKKKKNIK